MTDDEIRNVLRAYVTAEMALLPSDDEIPKFSPYSRRYRKRIRELLGAHRYFSGRVSVYRVVRRAAIFVIILLSLLSANTISAHVFGIDPWKYITSFVADVIMEKKTFVKNESVDMGSIPKPISDRPTYVPEGYIHRDELIKGTYSIDITWESADKFNGTKDISYSRVEIDESSVEITDAEYESVKNVSIAGLLGQLYKKGEEYWLDWRDENYSYDIDSNGIDNPETTLKRMAESIYEKK